MYDRNYDGKTLSFEPSGGLMNASLVMQDRETDTFWSIMSGKAEAGALDGTALIELPVSEKMSWAEWRARHPDTLVLSVTRTTRTIQATAFLCLGRLRSTCKRLPTGKGWLVVISSPV